MSSAASATESSQSDFQLSSHEFRKAFPRQYLEHFLQNGLRPDGRLLTESRPTSVHTGVFSSTDSSATAQRGGTVVTCGIKLEVGAPHVMAPRDGRLVVNVHMTPLAFPHLEIGRPCKESAALAELLSQVVLSGQVLQLSQLCISAGQAIWVAFADFAFLSYDGNALDVCLAALLAALDALKLPATQISEDSGIVTINDDADSTPLVLNRRPRAFTFGCFDRYLLLDPTAEEESLLSCRVSICYTEKGELCGVFKHGGAGVSAETLQRMQTQAKALACSSNPSAPAAVKKSN